MVLPWTVTPLADPTDGQRRRIGDGVVLDDNVLVNVVGEMPAATSPMRLMAAMSGPLRSISELP